MDVWNLLVTVFKGVTQVFLGQLEVVVKHVLPPDEELVGDELRFGVAVLERGGLDRADERFAQMHLVHFEVDLE